MFALTLTEALDLIARSERGELVRSEILIEAHRVCGRASFLWHVPVALREVER